MTSARATGTTVGSATTGTTAAQRTAQTACVFGRTAAPRTAPTAFAGLEGNQRPPTTTKDTPNNLLCVITASELSPPQRVASGTRARPSSSLASGSPDAHEPAASARAEAVLRALGSRATMAPPEHGREEALTKKGYEVGRGRCGSIP